MYVGFDLESKCSRKPSHDFLDQLCLKVSFLCQVSSSSLKTLKSLNGVCLT
nr:MAG TPA: hypothetical protein [Caudoviricetes sp.]